MKALPVACAVCVAALAAPLGLAGTTQAATPAPVGELVKRGEYLARVGDCVACHTAPQGAAFAGGLGLDSPIGKIYSTNITPDRDTGIGTWSYEDFARLMRTGVTKQGYTVYPAMPYPSYSRVTDEDMQALYAYFMHGVTPVSLANRKSDASWPLSARFPLTVWRWVFAPTPVADPASKDPVQHGAYLVEGLGHCGACHTPRGVAFQEKALRDEGSGKYLSGGAPVDGWKAPSLRNEHGGGLATWSADDIAALLKTGRNSHSATFGGMNDVVVHSTQNMSKDDVTAIAAYLKQLAPSNRAPAYARDDTQAKALFAGNVQARGAAIYVDRCAGCHRTDGSGATRVLPALAGNPALQSGDPAAAIKIVLEGGTVPATADAPSTFTMAPYASLLSDEQVADVVSFIQTSWGNQGGAASPAQVAKIRKK